MTLDYSYFEITGKLRFEPGSDEIHKQYLKTEALIKERTRIRQELLTKYGLKDTWSDIDSVIITKVDGTSATEDKVLAFNKEYQERIKNGNDTV